jgi:hypothetical protein
MSDLSDPQWWPTSRALEAALVEYLDYSVLGEGDGQRAALAKLRARLDAIGQIAIARALLKAAAVHVGFEPLAWDYDGRELHAGGIGRWLASVKPQGHG